MKAIVTGAAGFIGSNLVDLLIQQGHEVVGLDNFSTGQREFLRDASASPRFALLEGDVLDLSFVKRAVRDCDIVFHFAANADVRFGTQHPRKDLEQNAIGTHNVLEAMRQNGISRIAFSSTGSVYGEAAEIPTPENCPFPVQTSLYGASKLAAESLISAYCEGFNFQAWIFRFVSVLGERYSHGHVYDFCKQLRANPTSLTVLGDGTQRKSYLYVRDCVEAVALAISKASGRVNVLNLGTDGYCKLSESISWIVHKLGVNPEIRYSGGDRGWIGDNPFIFLSCERIRSLGWRPTLSIRDGILKTVEYLQTNPWLFESRL